MTGLELTTEKKLEKPSISVPRLLLSLEGFAVLAAAIAFYAMQGFNGWVFVLLLLVPDISMVAYLINPKVGAGVYNLVHFYGLPILLAALSLTSGWVVGLQLALIWLAHIGMDRLFGYGYKYPTEFKDTHLGRV
jgi:hypothetical protein